MDARTNTTMISSSGRTLGVVWLLAWVVGALMAWALPWGRVGGTWPQPSRWLLNCVADAVDALSRIPWMTEPWLSLIGLVGVGLLVVRVNRRTRDLSTVSHTRGFPRVRVLIVLFAVISGVWWTLASISTFLRAQPAEFAAPLTCRLSVGLTDLPKPGARVQRLQGRIQAVSDRADDPSCSVFHVGQQLLIRDYARHPPDYVAGQVWAFELRLKPPHGGLNPGGFDYERWLFAHRIAATASVRGTPVLIDPVGNGLSLRLAALRAELRASMLRVSEADPDVAEGGPGRGLLLGLTIGDGDYLPQSDWDALLATGTNHLLAISGLHVGMVAGLFAWFLGGLWSRTRWCEALPARRMAAYGAVIAAWGYALLAGMSVPTERAALMITILLAGVLLGRSWRLLDLWLVALLTVLLLDPFAPLTAGFWLSFGAVLVMVLWLQYRAVLTFWRDAMRLQVVLTLALLPAVWLMFDRIAWSSLPANLLAVPLVTLVITPMALLIGLLSLWVTPVAHALFIVLDWLAQVLFDVLHVLARWAPDSQLAAPPVWTILLAFLGMAWLLMPWGWPRRYLGVLLCLPAVVYRPPAVPIGIVDVHVLDVGQGLSVILRTADHAMLYDTGPAYLSSDAGARTVIPALRTLGVDRLDRIVISHHARDHAGGLGSVLARYPQTPVISGEPLTSVSSEPCRDGSGWVWDGVRFELFHARGMSSDNDRSCVLRVTDRSGSLLLTGDIEKRAETDLLMRHDLSADWLYVPHHGSKTSSSPEFLAAVHPRAAVVSAGLFNPFHHPNLSVMTRYRQAGIPVLNTAYAGEIHLVAGTIIGYRSQVWPYVWRRDLTLAGSGSNH